MIHPIPSGTRDVLPDEMRELRAIIAAVSRVVERAGYGEVITPALEYETVLGRADLEGIDPAYRFVDERGRVLVLRSDMTVPIARLVASRYANAPVPLRLSYVAPVYRSVRPQRGQAREMLQVGIELIGSPTPDGTVEALGLLCAVLDAAGLRDYRIGVGSAALYPALLEGLQVAPAARPRLLALLVARDFVGLEREVSALGLGREAADLLHRVPGLRGGPEVLDALEGTPARAVANLRGVRDRLDPEVAGRVIFDLGLVRSLGYYTGAVFEVYDPALGEPLGRGGRYDDLLGHFGRALPAVGFALNVERLHLAVAAGRGGPAGATS